MDDSKFNILLGYLARGWALVPLHDVSAGHCSCLAGVNCGRSAGKHPRYPRWQEDNQLVRDRLVLEAIHLAHPEWNWGVATGRPSGIWILDWDEDHAPQIWAWIMTQGHAQLANGLPDFGTLVLGPTGGGGRHYVFALPPDFEVKGSQTRNRYGLPPGLDVRGWHGQIVVAPSVSAKGPYGATLVDKPISRAPAWLENTLRLQPGDEVVDNRGGVAGGVTAAQVGAGDPRAMAYAAAAVRDLLAELESAPVGTRNDTAFRVAARLIELGNAPWTGYSVDVLRDAWWQSAAVHPDGAHVPAAELLHVWRSAATRIGMRAAELPIGYGGGETIPILGVVPDFPAAPAAAPAHSDMSSGGLPFDDPVIPSAAVDGNVDISVDPVTAMIDRMLTPEQLRELPRPVPLVAGLLDLATSAWLIGRPKSCKSFVSLDLAAHIGLGLDWQGRRVRQGRVVYVVAEGRQGIGLRVNAWEREYGPIKDLVVLPEPVPANERVGKYGGVVAGQWSVLVEACRRLAPALVIIDTQARVTVGLNENDNGDMSYYAAQADRIKDATGACVLTVHHMGRNGSNARGASAIDGAQDAELRVERASDDAMMITIHVDAQKDLAAEKPITVALRRSDGGIDLETGRDLSSLVLARPPEIGELAFQDPGEVLSIGETRAILLYRIIRDNYNAGPGGTESEIKTMFYDALGSLSAPLKRKAWARAWGGKDGAPGLVPLGLVAKRAGAARFKIIIVEDQSSAGVLTPNNLANPTLPPEGWNLYLPDDSPRNGSVTEA
jgi:hypothetical protein